MGPKMKKGSTATKALGSERIKKKTHIPPYIASSFKRSGMIIFLYAILVFSGGVMGFIKGGSSPSLIAGGLSGLSLLFCSVLTFTYRKWGLYFAFSLMLLLDGFFSYRYIKTEAFFPAGITLILTSLAITSLVISVIKMTKQTSEKSTH